MSGITALIRYKNSEKTLPEVLTALSNQSVSPDHLVAIDTGSTDRSTQLLQDAGAEIARWDGGYHHSKFSILE